MLSTELVVPMKSKLLAALPNETANITESVLPRLQDV